MQNLHKLCINGLRMLHLTGADVRAGAPLTEAVVALANTLGGDILIDTGSHSGAAADWRTLVTSQTVPPVMVTPEVHATNTGSEVVLHVPKARCLTSTADGRVLKRCRLLDGTFATVPMFPTEAMSRLGDLSAADFSSQAVIEATPDDLDAGERRRLRRLAAENLKHNDLDGLSDDELDAELGLTRDVDGRIVPTVAGLLMIGKSRCLSEILPPAKVELTVKTGSAVLEHHVFSLPLLTAFETLLEHLRTYSDKGLFDERSLRAVLLNALMHRDYSTPGAITVLLEDAGLTVTNPGGFVGDTTPGNVFFPKTYERASSRPEG